LYDGSSLSDNLGRYLDEVTKYGCETDSSKIDTVIKKRSTFLALSD